MAPPFSKIATFHNRKRAKDFPGTRIAAREYQVGYGAEAAGGFVMTKSRIRSLERERVRPIRCVVTAPRR